MIATCKTCGTRLPLTHVGGNDELWQHDNVCRLGQLAATVTQLPGVTFHEQALLAIRSLAVTGREFTIGECHALVGIAPLDPAHEWPKATNEAKRLGWIERISYGQSIVEGTNRSAVAVWRGTYAATRGAA
jgi:hypothetical protein